MKRSVFTVFLFVFLSIFSQAKDVQGQWIAPAEISSPNVWMAFRKDVNLDKAPSQAVASIAVDSKYWLWINGDIVISEGGLKRGPDPHNTYYDEVDLSGYLKRGKNEIAILVWYFGKEGFSHKSSGKAGLLFEMSASGKRIVSDGSWWCRIHPAYGNTEAPHPNFRLPESNIRFDARADIKGWQTADSPETMGFHKAVAIAKKGEAPYNELVLRPIPQWKDFGVKGIDKTEITLGEKADTIAAYFPYNLQMTPVLDITDPVGGNLVSIYTDNTYAAGDINLRAEYITAPGQQIYESKGWLNGHILYIVAPKGVTVNKISYRETGYATELTGSFSCSDDYINRYWQKSLRTLYVNMRDTFFDCPERERAQWWGDETLLMGECFYTTDMATRALMKKGMHELIAWQRPDSILFSPIPAGNYSEELPGQMLASIGWYGFWNYYMNTGDKQTIADVYPGVRKYLGIWTLDDTGLTNFRSGGWTWGDWGDNKDVRLIFAGWHYLALKAAHQMALLLGHEADAEEYAATMARVKDAYNKCWNGKEYRHPDYKDCTDDRVQALAVISGIADEDKYPQILEVLKHCFHASPYMEKYVTEALFMMGEGNYAIRRMKERYAPMVNHPFYTTLFEGWDIGENGFGGGTVNHAWSGGELITIAQYVCGITPQTPGWKTFNIKPDCNVLKYTDITVPTSFGNIHSSVISESDRVLMDVTVPEGTTANVTVPGEGRSLVYINDVPQPKADFYTLTSGTYRIEKIFEPEFAIGNGEFILNGRPFIVKAAELHYPRIPREYWEHRIRMCKALGMNTICMYVFWNYHERKEGEFSFEGNADIAEFCRLAQKHGMYVIVRPGPYVCAEWEMGGLPWWLLKKKDVKLRTLDPYYMDHVRLFLNRVGKELAPLQISEGGNIIMVQVENEYGAYGTDKQYITQVKNTLLESGFTGVPLFQCDWNTNFTNNGLDDLLWTMNFGTGADIRKQFARLKQLRPGTPLMCSEFWSGWFDHWGRKHETRPAGVMVDGIRDMLEDKISFSLYMTHGGTTFGHWGGANNPPFSAMCSSYDYDAPISESGRATEKYMLLRNLLSKYSDSSSMPQIPDSLPIIGIPEFRFREVSPIFDNLPRAKKSREIRPMEEFDQGWGTILYKTKFNEDIPSGATLAITELHDWGQIYIDGKLIARLDRRKGEFTAELPAVSKGSRLDILVEAMGRVNFDKSIHDRKGITEKVEIISGSQAVSLHDWKVYNFPVDYEFTSSRKFREAKGQCPAPAYWKAEFEIDKAGDTFLDMRSWGKGLVWVNGHEIGRFWQIGPQQTLFVPGCWLKEGKNEIYVLDLLGCKEPVIKGLETPILDGLRSGDSKAGAKKVIDLKSETAVHEGSFAHEGGWQEVRFDKPAEGRYFCLEMLSLQNEGENAAIAELDILGPDGKPVSRENWKICFVDSEDSEDGNHSGEKVFDLQESTFWSAAAGEKCPHQLVIEMESNISVTGFRYLPRAESGCPGMIKDYKVYLRQYDFTYAVTDETAVNEGLTILPYPQKVDVTGGNLVLSSDRLSIGAVRQFKNEVGLFIDQMAADNGIDLKKTDVKKAAIRILKDDSLQNEEAYALSVSEDGVVVRSHGAAGAFYALQTLSQIMIANGDGVSIPECNIEDAPQLGWRSFMLDEGRSFKGMSVVKQLLDDMARLKMNVFHWHLTDDQGWRIEIRKYPLLTEVGARRDSTQVGWYEYNTYDGKPHEGFYTQAQIKEIIEYAAARHITVVPEIEMPGHSAAAVAAYPWLSAAGKQIRVPCKFGVQYNVFNPADERVLGFLEDVLDEVMDLFPSKVIHIGGDEVRYDEWKNSKQVMDFIAENNLGSPAGLQVWFTNKIASYIESKGRRMMGWNDITGDQLHHFQNEAAETTVGLSPDAVVQFWSGKPELMLKSARHGNDIVNSFNEYTYLDYSTEYDSVQATYNWKPISLEKAYSFSPVPDGFPEELKSKVIGAGCQMWGEWIPTVEKMNHQVYPRIAAYAEAFWSAPSQKDFARFQRSLRPFLTRWSSR